MHHAQRMPFAQCLAGFEHVANGFAGWQPLAARELGRQIGNELFSN
jgi:hypothetical protein